MKEKKFAERSPNATLPALETEDGNLLTQSIVIATYLASFKPELLGSNDFEKAQVD